MGLSVINNIAPTVVAHGICTTDGSFVCFEHNLGFVPDFVYVYNIVNTTGRCHAAMYNSQYSTTMASIQYRYNVGTVNKSTTYRSTSYFYLDETKCSFPYITYTWDTSANTTYWVAGKF